MRNIRPATPRPARHVAGPIRSVQVLRAVAALFVVGFHSTVLWRDKFAPAAAPWLNGNAGVDIFFVISGFIMIVSSRRLASQADGWRRFMKLRLIRIVPLYWLATVLKLVAVIAVPAMALHTSLTPWNSIASFLFIPARDGTGHIRPVFDAGWTLSFEMLFYMVFATAMFFRLAPLRLVAPVMLALALLALARPAGAAAFTSLASPLVLEFVFGAVLAQAYISGALDRLAAPWMILPAIFGLLCVTFVPADGIWLRVGLWGGAATLLLLGCVLAERWLDPVLPRFFEWIGEASYSLYLVHGFVLPVIGIVIEIVIARTPLHGAAAEALLVTLCMAASTAAALVVYECVEAPVTAWLRAEHPGGRHSFLHEAPRKLWTGIRRLALVRG